MAQSANEFAPKSRWQRIWPPALSAALVFLAFCPLKLSFLVFVALVPWLLYLSDSGGKRGFRSGYLFGFVFWLGELSFIAQFVGEWTHSFTLGFVPYLLGCLYAALYFGLFGWLAGICYQRSIVWAVPIVWAGVEAFRSYLIGIAFPFGLLAMPLTSAPAIIQSAHYGSVFLTSAWVALANVTIAELIRHRSFSAVRWHVAVFFLVLAGSMARYSVEPGGTARTVAAGQPGVNMAFGDQSQTEARIAKAVEEISQKAAGADLLVLPEGIVKAGNTMPPPILFHVDPSLPVVFGGQRAEKPSYQSAFSYDGHWEFADKTRLVVFGEYVPLRDVLPIAQTFNMPGGDLKEADHVTSLHVGKFKVGAAICFEALFPDVPFRHVLNGSNLIAVMSVDDWYFGSVAPDQLRDASNWRAIEAGVPVVRAASMGYSIIVDARGRTVASAPLLGTQTLVGSVRVPAKPDYFPLFPVFPYLSVAFLPALLFYDLMFRLRLKRAASVPAAHTAPPPE